ncbi:sugar phosphate isomerase/epimerase family protein [Alkalicoccus luteus]|uniref:sugar phosphate isomerase/epimerase family protein n=1 Tax=Alkalicoccus luteus TaxID=1237094 RepID=UPI0040336226
MTLPVAVQLFTLREEAEQDFKGTLREVAKVGYEGVEFAGFGGLTADEVKDLLEETGLKPAASHVPIDQLRDNLDDTIAFHQAIGCTRLVCPYLDEEDRDSITAYEAVIGDLRRIAAACSKEGISLSYHHHDFELKPIETVIPLKKIWNTPGIQAEIDIYWLVKAGENPVEWIKKYADSTELIHLKDMTTDGTEDFAELGTGGIDIEACVREAEKAGVQWLIVEQDQSRIGAMKSIKKSYEHLTSSVL